MKRTRPKQSNDRRFDAASTLWDQGELRRAFRLFLSGAKAGDVSCQVNLGYFYDEGIGVKANPIRALFWYRKAYRAGCPEAACNIGIILWHHWHLTGRNSSTWTCMSSQGEIWLHWPRHSARKTPGRCGITVECNSCIGPSGSDDAPRLRPASLWPPPSECSGSGAPRGPHGRPPICASSTSASRPMPIPVQRGVNGRSA